MKVISFRSGSVLTDVTSFFNGIVPASNTLTEAVSGISMLMEGNTTLMLNTSAASLTECTNDYCSNGGTCERSGVFPPYTFSCSCQTGFSGDKCEAPTVITPITTTPTMAPVEGELSSLAIVLVIVGSAVLVILILVVLVCSCVLMRRQYEKGLGQQNERLGRPYESRRNNGFEEYDDRSQHSSDRDDELGRMERLIQVMGQSPYLQQGLPHQHGFFRPYMVTGNEETRRQPQRSDGGPIVARNPLASMY